MPTEDIPPLTVEQVNRMLAFALNTKKLKDKLMDTSQLINEINIEYARTMNKIIFDDSMQRPQAAQKMLVEAENFPLPEAKVVPDSGCVTVPAYDFAEQFSEFSFYTCLTKSEVITATVKVRTECNKVIKMNLFNLHFNKSVRLEDFEQSQTQASDQANGYLKESWVVTLKNAITNTFKDSGKGWFNVQKTNHEIHDFSKLKKFLNMTKFTMEDSLRFLVEDSLLKYVVFLEKSLCPVVEVRSTSEVEQIKPRLYIIALKKPPLFAIEILMKDEKFEYSTDPAKFEPRLKQIFEHAMKSCTSIPQLDPSIMEGLFFTHIPMLNSVHSLEPHVSLWRERLGVAVQHAVTALHEYLAFYAPYEKLLRLDINEYIKGLETSETGLSELTAEIDKHAKELVKIENAIPASVTIGPFAVSTKKVLTALMEKISSLLAKTKDFLAQKPKKMCEEIVAKYKDLNKQLMVKSSDPETVRAQRELMDMMPKLVQEMQEITEQTKPFYLILDNLRYELPDADFDTKNLAQTWPAKIEATCEMVEKVLAEDQERYRTEQMEAQESFELQLNEINNTISMLQQYTDVNAVDNVVVHMTKVQTDIKAAEEQSHLYNSRETLFGQDPTD